MSDSSDTYSSSPKLSAPTLYPAELAQLLLLKQQCNRYEKSTLSEIQVVQEQQLAALFRHAARYSSFWHDRLTKAKYSPDTPSQRAFLGQLPTLSRTELQQYFDDIKARWPGLNETQLMTAQSSGSTGQPVRVEKEASSYMNYYTAISLIEHEWQQRDPRKKLAVLGTGMKPVTNKSWGQVYEMLGMKGVSEVRAAEAGTLTEHLDWLTTLNPAYLKCSPVLAMELAITAIEQNRNIQFDHVISHWERITPAHRYWVRRAFNAEIIDRYSCEELGWIATSCPEQHLHVCSPTVLLEIVNDDNQPCSPGQPGRVLVTALQSFAMPLIRYELGDLAEWGQDCPCGRPMPVLKKIWGRERHLIQRPDGTSIPMPFLGDQIGKIPIIRAFRFRQYADRDIVLEVESMQKLGEIEIRQLAEIIRQNGLGGMPFHIAEVDQIKWPAQRKREEFIRIAQPWQGKL